MEFLRIITKFFLVLVIILQRILKILFKQDNIFSSIFLILLIIWILSFYFDCRTWNFSYWSEVTVFQSGLYLSVLDVIKDEFIKFWGDSNESHNQVNTYCSRLVKFYVFSQWLINNKFWIYFIFLKMYKIEMMWF